MSHSGGGHARARSGASATARRKGALLGEMALAAPRASVASDATVRRGTGTWTICSTFFAVSRPARRLCPSSLTLDTWAQARVSRARVSSASL